MPPAAPGGPARPISLELVAVGTELLLGFTVDTNGAHIARVLGERGIRIARRTAVADRPEEIRAAVGEALARTGAVITTGGLGPTRDDITKHSVAGLFGAELRFDPRVWDDLLARFRRLGRTPVESNRSQAQVPFGATVLRNRWGTAPGLWLEGPPGLVVMLPGVPYEMRMLLEHEVLPRLVPVESGRVVRSRLVRTTGIPESSLAERLADVEREVAPLSLAYLPGLEGVDLRLTAWNLEAREAESRLAAAGELLAARAGEHCYGSDDADLAAVVLDQARHRGIRLGVAESCTGGLLGGRLTDIPGSSDVFVGGVICYANELKTGLLDVDQGDIARYGAVSEPVALALAEGARRRLGVDLAVSVTGIAGPGGGSEEKPVGTVWFGLAGPERREARRTIFAGTRQEVRGRAAQAALFLLYRRLLTS